MITVDGPPEMLEIHRRDRDEASRRSLGHPADLQASLAAESSAKLTDSEKKVLRHLGDAWNEFVLLPGKHGDDIQDVRSAIHRIQDIIATYVARRLEPDVWFWTTH